MAFLYKIITFLNESENRVGILPTASINLSRSETGRLVYFIGELYDRTYRLGSVTIKTKCVKLNY